MTRFKKVKDPLYTDHYRGFTITPILVKALEHIILNRIKEDLQIDSNSNLLFYYYISTPYSSVTLKGMPPTMAILSVTEAVANPTDKKSPLSPLYLLTLEVRKVFEVVHHDFLCHKHYHWNDTRSWKCIQHNLMSLSQVTISGRLGELFKVDQGVGQGKILSTHCYKTYIHDLLSRLEEASYGYYCIGSYVSSPTCSDDLFLIASNQWTSTHS